MSNLFNFEEKQVFYSKPPLVFQGNKKNALKNVIKLIKEIKQSGQKDYIFIDAFGGSGLLSNTFKYYFPENEVIFNDFDDYTSRLEKIPQTNEILSFLKNELKNFKTNEKIYGNTKEKILAYLQQKEKEDKELDYLSISSFVLFSGDYAKNFKELAKKSWFYKNGEINRNAQGYLEGVKRVKMDFKELLNEYKDNKNAFLILDPPYLQTNTQSYKAGYYRLSDFLALIDFIRPPYILFSSLKSDILDFLAWYDTKNDRLKNRKILSSSLGFPKTIEKAVDYMIYELNAKSFQNL
ncbi:hypothetical protein DMB92_09135 [Campylobacter sp. MIT 99-7217]|uniref:DNA adenine methylase n=1 Tax=Campylobacter sp. MIT 99-7217 TaxID=535091 RepID=UPI00115A132F|nr:DNA adenine methylase [Campylobacter sp. MIT 99-7217]TQR28469.1 hypothetical protein DMB92_09135 [Campylobacter sp. MIT 99-7217]